MQVNARIQTFRAMSLYMSRVKRTAWKALLLFYWQSVADRQKRKLVHLQNMRYRSDTVMPAQKMLKKPAGYNSNSYSNNAIDYIYAQSQQQPGPGTSGVSTHTELLAMDLLSSDEEETDEDEGTSVHSTSKPHIFLFCSLNPPDAFHCSHASGCLTGEQREGDSFGGRQPSDRNILRHPRRIARIKVSRFQGRQQQLQNRIPRDSTATLLHPLVQRLKCRLFWKR